jgi:hypothetical protein
MKFSKLLVLSALWLTGLGANAANLNERVAPETPDFTYFDDVELINKTAADFVVGDCYVLYNKGAEKYYFEGNAWGTQATGSIDQAMIVRFVMPSGKSLDDKQLYLRNNVPNKGEQWMTAFVTFDGKVTGVYGDGTPALFVDNSDGTAALMWVEGVGDKTYRISISESNSNAQPEGCFMGIDPNGPGVEGGEDGTCIMPKLSPDTEGVCLDWEFYPVPEWTSYFKEKDIYDKSEELRKQIEAAESAGINVDDAVAVYNDLNSTIAQMQAAIEALQAAMAGGLSGATPDNPVDATNLIQNPNFDDASNEGWEGTKPNMVGSGAHGPANVAEVYNNTFDTYQKLAALPAGVYALRANTAFRGSWEDLENGTPAAAKLYIIAGEQEQSVPFNNIWSCYNTVSMAGATEFGTSAAENGHGGYYSPNDPSAFRLYEEAGYYKTTLFFDKPEGDLQLGVKNPAKCTDGCDNWSIFDTFSLMYYGNEPGSYQKWVELSLPEIPEDAFYTEAYMDAFKAAAAEMAATNREEALAAIEGLKPYIEALQENIKLWKQWKELLAEVLGYIIDEKYAWTDAAGELSDYLDLDAVDIEDARALTNEELVAEMNKLKDLIELMKKQQLEGWQPGQNVTYLLTNPGYQEGGKGWTVEGGGTSGSPLENKNFEVYHVNNFNVWQEVNAALPGVYEIQVQGFSRYDGGATTGDVESCPEAPIFLYMNSATTRFPNLWSAPMPAGTYGNDDRLESWYLATDAEGNEYPNSMGSASQAFDLGLYQMSTFGVVREGETMRIGVKGTNCGQNWWTLWDNFQIIYQGTQADVVKPALEAALLQIDATKPMGKSIKASVDQLIAEANAAMETNDGDAMFKALNDVYDLIDAIRESVALFEKLQAAAEDLIGVASESGSASKNEALALADEIQAAIEARSIENADVEAYMVKIAAMKTKLRLPENMNAATDEAPVDATAVIETPGFEKDATNSIFGWTATGQKFGNSDQLSAMALESWESIFHIYQDIYGLPEGTYTLKVNGWERTGSPTYLYAESNGQTFAKELITQEAGLPEGMTAPGGLIDARNMFDETTYMNQIVLKHAGDKLRIGVRKDQTTSADWIVIDEFQLWYHGANSSLTPDGDATGIENVAVPQSVKVEYFTLDGRKATSVQKGILIQKVTFENGSVVVRKIRK